MFLRVFEKFARQSILHTVRVALQLQLVLYLKFVLKLVSLLIQTKNFVLILTQTKNFVKILTQTENFVLDSAETCIVQIESALTAFGSAVCFRTSAISVARENRFNTCFGDFLSCAAVRYCSTTSTEVIEQVQVPVLYTVSIASPCVLRVHAVEIEHEQLSVMETGNTRQQTTRQQRQQRDLCIDRG
jgi:hypothetical protein